MKEKWHDLWSLVPGIALLAVVGYAGKLLERWLSAYAKANHLTMPNIEYVLWAILLGLLIANTTGISKIFLPGIKTYEFFLKLGIVLLGVRFLLGDVVHLGGISLALVVVEIIASLLIMTWLGKLFGLNPKLTSLLAVGSGICGVSAIIATQGAIDADEKDSGIAIMAILSLGAVALFTFPPIGHFLHLSDKMFGLWAGLGVDNTAEAVATGAMYSDTAGKLAVLVKTCRNAMIGFVVLGYALYWAKQGMAKAISNKSAFLWKKFPKFVLGFLVLSALASLKLFDKTQLTSLANVSRWAFLLTFAGVGLRTDVRAMFKQGARPFVVGALGEFAIALITLGLVLGANAAFTL